jgi:hypothetical protein
MSRPTLPRLARRRAALLLAAAAAGVGAACNEDFVTGPRDNTVTLELAGWADTVVLGDVRTVRVRVLDAQGREVVGVPTQLDIAAAGAAGARTGTAVLESRLNAAGASAARLGVASATDSVALAAAGPGAATAVLTLLDPRFTTTAVQRTATVVVAGVRAATAHDTTMTALGDTSVAVATALARQGTGAGADYLPVPGQGVTWTRRGSGAVRLVGAGDSVRVIAEAAGTDTLIASHARCLAGARCADTTVVRVAQGGALGLDARTFRAWSLGDSVVPQIVLADARGNAIVGARLDLVPLTAADSALVGVNSAAGVPAPAAFTGAPAAAGPRFSRAAEPALRLVARGAASTAAARAVSAAPLAAPPLVAKANGTARVAVRALAADGTLLASDTVSVVVRQIARVVHVAPADADLTPGDSIPVAVTAVDGRGHLIADADFQPAMAGAVYRAGRIVVPVTAAAGQRATLAMSVVGVAQPNTYPVAATADPAPDSARVRVRVPAPATAGDTSSAAASDLTTTVLDAAGRPRTSVWVRFKVPAGAVVGADSVMTDGAGVARARWALPTRAGSYTATAVVLADLAAGVRPDSAGQIVLRRSATVVPGAPAAVVLRAALPATAPLGSALAPAPVVQVEDAYGNPVPQSGIAVSVSLAGTAPGFTLTGTLAAVTDADGRASFPGIVGAGAPGTYTLQFTGTGAGATPAALTPVTGPVQFTGSAPAPTPAVVDATRSTVVLSAPTVASGGTVTATVTPRDGTGASMGAGRTIVVSVPASPAPGSATAAVTPAVDHADGTYTATLTGVRAGTAFAVTATADGTALTQAPTLAVTPGAPHAAASSLAVSATALAHGQTATATVHVADAAGNVVTGAAPADVALAASLGSLGAVACAGGTCTATYTATTAGSAAITATIGGAAVAGSPATITVGSALVATQAVASTTLDAGGAHAHFVPVTVSGGTAPTTLALTGTLPAGLTFDAATGAVCGTATASHPATTYTVTATDAAGATASATFVLRVDGPPSAPAVGAVTPGDGTLAVAFTAPAADGGSAITGYSHSTDNGATWSAAAPATSPLVITGLTNGTTYQLRLRAENAIGAGAPSAAAPGTPATAPSAPAITGVAPASGQLSVAFTAPAHDGGAAVTNYQYSLDGGATWQTRAPASAASPLVVAGLTNGTTYQVALRAVNAAGAGAPSAPASGTPSGPPGAPTALAAASTGSSSVSLTWAAPASDGGSPITDYTVQYSTGGAWTTVARAPSTATSQTVGSLGSGAHTFRVAAVNAIGTGPTSATATATPGAAGPTTNLAVIFNQTSETAQDGTLTWSAPTNTGTGTLTDYRVEYKLASATTWTTLARTASTATSATFTNLGVATTYQFRVSAVTTVGTGAPSAVLTATTTGPSERLACISPGTSNASASAGGVAPCSGSRLRLGDLIVIPVTIQNETGVAKLVTAESGFHTVGTSVTEAGSGGSQTTVFYKVATAADLARGTDSSYHFEWRAAGNVKNVTTLVAYRGIDTSAIGFIANHGTGTTASSATVTETLASRYTLAYFYTMAEVAMSGTAPTVKEWTVSPGVWKNTTAGANNANAAAVVTADIDRTAAGTMSPQTARTGGMSASTKWNAITLVLRPTP